MLKKMREMPVFLVAMGLLLLLALMQIVLPDRTESEMENRTLRQWTAPEIKTILSGRWMQDTEAYVDDQFPAREGWMYLQSAVDDAMLRTERNGILYGSGGWMFEQAAGLQMRTAQANLDAMQDIAAGLDTPVTVAVVPMSSAVLPSRLPQWYTPDNQREALDGLYGRVPDAETVDILGAMQAEAMPEQLYFQTDHHWTAEGALSAYRALMAAWGMGAGTDASIIPYAPSGFFGTYFSRSPNLRNRQGDAFAWLEPETTVQLVIDGTQMDTLHDPQKLESRDKYAALLWGNHGHITLLGGASSGVLAVIKDSYANMLLPLLAQHFERVEVIDPRYFAGDLPAFLRETEADRILCMYGLTTILSDRSLPMLAADFAP